MSRRPDQAFLEPHWLRLPLQKIVLAVVGAGVVMRIECAVSWQKDGSGVNDGSGQTERSQELEIDGAQDVQSN